MARQFGIFAKHWRPGQVKTRLAAGIGCQAAARFYRLSLETLLRRFSRMADGRVLAFSPADCGAEFAALIETCVEPHEADSLDRGNWSIEPQAAGDLGKKI